MASKANKKTYYPNKDFDDGLAALVELFKQKGWVFAGVDQKQLETDAAEQRSERLTHDTLESQYKNVHESFGVAQEQRYERFMAALGAARGAFRRDKAVMAELERFKRASRRSRAASMSARAVKKSEG